MTSHLNRLADWVISLSSWGKITLYFAVVFSLDSVLMAWGEKRFVGGFFESIVACFLYWLPVLGFFVAPFWGSAVSERFGKAYVGWIVGISVFLGFVSVREFGKLVPGVGWRIEALEAAREEAMWDY